MQSLLTSPWLREVLGERLQSLGMEQDWDLGLQTLVYLATGVAAEWLEGGEWDSRCG